MRLLPPPHFRYHLRSVLLLTFSFMVGLALLLYLISGEFNVLHIGLVLVVGAPVGLLVGTAEVYLAPRLLTNRPLGLRLLLNTGLHLLLFWLLLWLGGHFIEALQRAVALQPSTAQQLNRELVRLGLLPAAASELNHSPLTRLLVMYSLLALGLSSIYQLGRKVGRQSLLRVIFGQYNQPAEEKRLFLFADVKDSTVLAEQLGNLRYSAFIRDFFADLGRPIAASGGEVYQYVGDEVVVTWPWQTGLHHARCLRCFFAMQQAVHQRQDYYLAHYGVVPTFKAGLHGGAVVATQVGDLKTELVFHGDVLNTTARIQAQCNALRSRFLVSGAVLEALATGLPYQLHPMGSVALRGKAATVPLFDVQLAPTVGVAP